MKKQKAQVTKITTGKKKKKKTKKYVVFHLMRLHYLRASKMGVPHL